MTRRLGFVIVCGSFTLLSAACATKSFVQKQLSETETRVTHLLNATETLLANRSEAQETKLRETVDRAVSSRETVDRVAVLASDAKTQADSAAVAAGDAKTRADSAAVAAEDAKTRADSAALAARDAEARLSQRLADRNKYRLWETRVIYIDSDRAEIRSVDIKALEDLAKALGADANAILELQGFADPRGSDRYNDELARERVEAVVRYLVKHHGIEPRQLRAVTMGKAALGTGDKPSKEALAEARRVDIRLLAPWSSWEDTQAQIDQSDEAVAASPPTSVEADRPATQKIAPRDALKEDAPGTTWLEIMKTISPQDLGAKD
jgi:outer membrane protein OmpA-like peptidoglycan-associated protein